MGYGKMTVNELLAELGNWPLKAVDPDLLERLQDEEE
jgi:hypothetical protein